MSRTPSPLLLAAPLLLLATPLEAQSGAYHPEGALLGLNQRGDRLISFDAGAPGTLLSSRAITGLAANETLLALDFRPSTGELLALGTSLRLYRLDTATGAASAVSAAPFTASIAGDFAGIDVNPVPDLVRVVTSGGTNLRVNPNTGALTALDTPLAYDAGDPNALATPRIVAAAYTNNVFGASSTTNYAIDADLNLLVTQGSPGGSPVSPNTGRLFSVGTLGVDASEVAGFDISPFGGAFLVLSTPSSSESRLFTLDLATGAATARGAIGGGERVRDLAVRPPALPRVFALRTDDVLVTFRPGTPGSILATLPVTGLQPGEHLRGIDFRPSTGELYALSDQSRVYTIDTLLGAASAVGAAPFAPALAGVEFGFDFNPIPDRMRVVSDAEQNLRLNPSTGAVANVDTPLEFDATDVNAGQPRTVVAAAYTNSVFGAQKTTLYAIDSGLDILVAIGGLDGNPSPNGGKLFTRGPLGLDVGDLAGFDVSPLGGALAALTPSGAASSTLYRVNLETGALTAIAGIGAGLSVRDIAIEPPGPPTLVGYTVTNRLVSFRPGKAGALLSDVAVTGLQPGERLVALDCRPAGGELIGVGSTNRLYRVDRASGAALAIGAGPFSPGLIGTEFGADFNPLPDRLRLVSDADQNLRLHPRRGQVTNLDAPLAFDAGDPNALAARNVVASAYTNNFFGATSTSLYAIDFALDALVLQGSLGGAPVSPNSGTLFTVGALGSDTGAQTCFDISVFGGACASLTAPGAASSTLVTVNLATGLATLVGPIGGEVLLGLTALPPGL